MADKKELLNKRKQSLLVELESIKQLLDDKSDTIPILDEAVIDDGQGNYTPTQEATFNKPINTSLDHLLESIPDTTMPAAPSDMAPSISEPQEHSHQRDKSVLPGQQSLFDSKVAGAQAASKKAQALGDNPFLPKHVRKRLENPSQNPATISANAIQQIANNNAGYTERLVDQLVAKHLPKLEAELRQKLLEAVNMKSTQQANQRAAEKPPKKSL